MVKYPSVEDIVIANEKVLEQVKAKKADSFKILSRNKIEKIIDQIMSAEGDIYDKAACLLKGIVQAHAFASGNRRTAFLVVRNFLFCNNSKTAIANVENAYMLQGVREGYYTHDEIKDWLLTGEIREFKR